MSELNLSILTEALDRFSAPARKTAGASGKLTERLKDGQAAEMDKATRRTATPGRALAQSAKPTKKLQQQFDAARRASDALKKRNVMRNSAQNRSRFAPNCAGPARWN